MVDRQKYRIMDGHLVWSQLAGTVPMDDIPVEGWIHACKSPDKCGKYTDVPPSDEMKLNLVLFNDAVERGDKDAVVNEMGNLAYEFGLLFERLEHANIINGNGHHMAQGLSRHVIETLQKRH